MEIFVLSDVTLEALANWQHAIGCEGFPLVLEGNEDLASVRGYLPARLEQRQTGFECYHIKPQELIDSCHGVQFGREWKYVLELVWGGDFTEMQAATMAGTAYARATGGVVFDPQTGQFLTASEAFAAVQEAPRILPRLETES
jgi:hypothetical protein